jgi:hypothetical protein
MATAASPSSNFPSRPTYSCIRCADRKVKCNRERPCSACVKHNVDCVFNTSQPPRKRHKRVIDQVLTDRLRHYEALLQEHGIDPRKLHVPETPESELHRRSNHLGEAIYQEKSPLQTPSSNEVESSRYINGQFVEK